ncbi:MAG: hypothetical protein M1611_01110 [Candidatus Marsarchaeota archaeon]|nr:hypothetical protein [Candidatus Marsarchaeota archaeon]
MPISGSKLHDTRSGKEWRDEIVEDMTKTSELIMKMIIFELRNAVDRQSIAAKFVMLLGLRKLYEKMAPYVGAVMMLSFVGRPVSREDIEAVLEGAGVEPEKRFMDFVLSMNFENNIVSYAVFAYFLRIVRMEITAENITMVAKTVGMAPDEEVIRHVLELYEESEADGTKIGSVKITGLEKRILEYGRDAAIVTGRLLTEEMDRTLSRKGVDEYVKRGFMYYVLAAGTLAFAGMIQLLYDKRTGTIYGYDKFLRYIANLVKTAGLEPEQEMLEYIKSFNYGYSAASHCVPVIYYLKSIGKEPSIEAVSKVLERINLPTEDTTIGFVLTTYNNYETEKQEEDLPAGSTK